MPDLDETPGGEHSNGISDDGAADPELRCKFWLGGSSGPGWPLSGDNAVGYDGNYLVAEPKTCSTEVRTYDIIQQAASEGQAVCRRVNASRSAALPQPSRLLSPTTRRVNS